jgi:hypothetical protein
MAVGTGGAGGNGGGDGGSGASGGAQAGSGGGGGGGTAAAGGGGGAAGGANATAGEAGVSEAGGEGGDALGAAGNGGGGGGGGGFFGGGGGGGADGESGASGGGGGGGSGFASPDAIAVLGNLEDAITQDVEGNGRALIITVGCAAVAVFKVVDSAPPGPTTFTVRVACTSGSTDLTYDESGSALGEEIFEAEPGDTCSVTETGTGGASHTTYRCTDLFGEPCGAGGQQIQFTSEVTPQIALVIVTNSFVLEVQPRLAG